MTEPAWPRLLRAWNQIQVEAGRADESEIHDEQKEGNHAATAH